jgi:hypothetical protein
MSPAEEWWQSSLRSTCLERDDLECVRLLLAERLSDDRVSRALYLADLKAIGAAFGERGYRAAELEAGLVAGRAYIAAYAVGRGATGLTFYDGEVTRFFSPHAIGLEPLLVVAVGVPAKR